MLICASCLLCRIWTLYLPERIAEPIGSKARAIADPMTKALGQPVIVDSLNAVEVKERFATVGAEAAPSSREEFGAFIRSDIARWVKVIKEAGIKVE
jgi:hypothetical protein